MRLVCRSGTRMQLPSMFSAERVLDVLNLVPEAVLDGGWGVDALVGSQTRLHDDLDLVVPLDACDRIVAGLGALGFDLHVDERPTRSAARTRVAPDGSWSTPVSSDGHLSSS